MPRPNKVWFRKDVGWWMVTLGGKKIRLAEGKHNKRQAEQKLHELLAVRPQAPEAATARVADVIEAFLAWTKLHRSAETNRNYLWYGQSFSEHAGFLQASDVKPIHVTRWVDERGWKGTTERNARRSIYRAFSWGAEQGLLPRNPLHGMKCPRAKARQRFMTDDEYRALLRNTDAEFKLLLFALKQTGCRPKEARDLRWSQVREDRWVLAEHKTAHKVQKPRVVYQTPPMRKLMAVLRRRAGGAAGATTHVFTNARGRPWTRDAVRQRMERLRTKLSLPEDLCVYLLRHAFGTNAVLNGVDVATVAQLMGHSSLEMVSSVYLHLADQHQHLQDAVELAITPPAHRRPARRVPREPPAGAADE